MKSWEMKLSWAKKTTLKKTACIAIKHCLQHNIENRSKKAAASLFGQQVCQNFVKLCLKLKVNHQTS